MKRHVRRHAVVSIALAALICGLPGAARTQAGQGSQGNQGNQDEGGRGGPGESRRIHRARFGHGLALRQGNGDNEGGNR
jgi:hypothetical protein